MDRMLARAGFVLAGGQSARMGRDKAMLAAGGEPLLVRIANRVRQAAGSVTVIGPPERYQHLGYEVVPDRIPGAGPLGGIDTALGLGRAEWNLVVACDLPRIGVDLLTTLLERASRSAADCVVARTDRPEPLCAVYSLQAAAAIRAALDDGLRMVRQALEGVAVEWHPVENPGELANVNTEHDWEAFLG